MTHERMTNYPQIDDNQMGYKDIADGMEEIVVTGIYVC